MCIEKLHLENYTVFDNLNMYKISKGVNIFIGENGTGKTHLLKVLYAALQGADIKTSFAQKLVDCMLPDDYELARLVHIGKEDGSAIVQVDNGNYISLGFSKDTRKWYGVTGNEEQWQKSLSNKSVFIPVKEILSNSYKLNAAVAKSIIKFDATYLDILDTAKINVKNENDKTFDALLPKLESVMDGHVKYNERKDAFYLVNNGNELEFSLVAEGIRKIALLWQLIKLGAIDKDTVLFWDEPEANINPKNLAIVVESLLFLARHGVQVFVSTHSYILAKYFEVRKQASDELLFHSFSKENGEIQYEVEEKFADLKNNSIIQSFDTLLDEVYNSEA